MKKKQLPGNAPYVYRFRDLRLPRSRSQYGWVVMFKRRSIYVSRWFYDTRLGGSRAAREAAVRERAKLYREVGPAVRGVLRPHGIVRRVWQRYDTTLGSVLRSDYRAWLTVQRPGKPSLHLQRSFSCHLYGVRGAQLWAERTLRGWLEQYGLVPVPAKRRRAA